MIHNFLGHVGNRLNHVVAENVNKHALSLSQIMARISKDINVGLSVDCVKTEKNLCHEDVNEESRSIIIIEASSGSPSVILLRCEWKVYILKKSLASEKK